jgi:hypothetical protein
MCLSRLLAIRKGRAAHAMSLVALFPPMFKQSSHEFWRSEAQLNQETKAIQSRPQFSASLLIRIQR